MRVAPRLLTLCFFRRFLERYPDIRLDLSLSDRITDLVEERTDLAIRIRQIDDPTLIAHRIGITRRVTVASASYFRDPSSEMLLRASNSGGISGAQLYCVFR
jgi:DNA-binding transcriptional LysR family regulator